VLEKHIPFDPRQHITLRGIYNEAFELGDKIVAYYETSDEVEKRYSKNPELMHYYLKVRRKKQKPLCLGIPAEEVWEFLRECRL